MSNPRFDKASLVDKKAPLTGVTVGGKYRIDRRIGKGSFGDIYLGIDIGTRAQVAIKVESNDIDQPQLKLEWKLYKLLEGGKGIPSIRWYGAIEQNTVLVMDLLGLSLEDLFDKCERKFSVKTVLMIGIGLIKRLEYIHTKCFIHRDIKPDNFLIGAGRNASTIMAIDFGLSKRYRHPKTHTHIRYCVHKHLTGTPRYSSVNSHLGIEQSRRDDLESVGFVLLYFLRGSLPWQGIKAFKKKHKHQKILEKKIDTTFAELCEGFPKEFLAYLKYSRNLKFDETPDYKHLRGLFRAALARNGWKNDKGFDWVGK